MLSEQIEVCARVGGSLSQANRSPIPIPQPESDFYWEKARQHELWLRKCIPCGKVYFYPRDISPCCFSRDTQWIKASGKATLYTYSIVYRPPHPGFKEDVPFVTAIVTLEEGPRISARITGVDGNNPQDIKTGMEMVLDLEDLDPEHPSLAFRPA